MPRPDRDLHRAPAWREPPQDEAPTILAAVEILASTPSVALALAGGRVYSNGLELQLEMHGRRRSEDDQEWERIRDVFFGRPAWVQTDVERIQALTIAVSVDDGDPVIADPLAHARGPIDTEPSGWSVALRPLGGNGNPLVMRSTLSLWLWRLPPANYLDISIRWPAFGIAKSTGRVDISGVAGLYRNSQRLWSND